MKTRHYQKVVLRVKHNVNFLRLLQGIITRLQVKIKFRKKIQHHDNYRSNLNVRSWFLKKRRSQ